MGPFQDKEFYQAKKSPTLSHQTTTVEIYYTDAKNAYSSNETYMYYTRENSFSRMNGNVGIISSPIGDLADSMWGWHGPAYPEIHFKSHQTLIVMLLDGFLCFWSDLVSLERPIRDGYRN